MDSPFVGAGAREGPGTGTAIDAEFVSGTGMGIVIGIGSGNGVGPDIGMGTGTAASPGFSGFGAGPGIGPGIGAATAPISANFAVSETGNGASATLVAADDGGDGGGADASRSVALLGAAPEELAAGFAAFVADEATAAPGAALRIPSTVNSIFPSLLLRMKS